MFVLWEHYHLHMLDHCLHRSLRSLHFYYIVYHGATDLYSFINGVNSVKTGFYMLLPYEGKSSKKSFLVKFECDVLLASFKNCGDLILVEFLNDSYVADRPVIDCKRMFGLAEREEINIEDVF